MDEEALERQIKSRYEDRLAEMEEVVESSSNIKKALAAEATRSAAALEAANAALNEARNRADTSVRKLFVYDIHIYIYIYMYIYINMSIYTCMYICIYIGLTLYIGLTQT